VALYDVGKLAELVANVGTTARLRNNNKAKGDAMADLVAYIFGEVPGLELRHRSLVAPDGTSEIDLVFRNRPHVSGLFAGVTLHFECKNESRRISAAQIRVFASKLQDRNQPIGIMVSHTGLSGRAGTRMYAHGVVANELHHGRTIVVLSLDDLAGLIDSDDRVELCVERQVELETYGIYNSI